MGVGWIIDKQLVQEVTLQHVEDKAVVGNCLQVVVAILAERHSLTHIQTYNDLLFERRADGHLGGIGIHPPIELSGGSGVARLEERASHVDDAFHQRDNLGSDMCSRGDVVAGADGDDGNLARVSLHLVDDKVDSLHVERLVLWLAAVFLKIDRLPGFGLFITGCSDVGVADTEQNALVFDGLKTAWIHRCADARHHWDVGAVDGL